LDAIYAKLKTGGILVISTVNPEAFQFHVIGRHWLHLDAPRHLTLIPIGLLADKMASSGAKLEMITTTDPGSIVCNSGGWKCFFVHTCAERYAGRLLLPILRPIMYATGIVVSRLVGPIERSKERGSAYTMVFRKVAESSPASTDKSKSRSDRAEKDVR
jgi:hypothetical protein